MDKLGLGSRFRETTKLLFIGAKAQVIVNRQPSKSFGIHREVWQGCPLAFLLFILVVEVLNLKLKAAEQEDNILDIKLRNANTSGNHATFHPGSPPVLGEGWSKGGLRN